MQLTWMQLKELLRIKSISLQCRCFVKEKCHLWISKNVVVMVYCVANVVNAVFRQKTSLFRGFLARVGSPSWKVGNVQKQNCLATFCGKLTRFNDSPKNITHLRTIISLVAKHVVSYKQIVIEGGGGDFLNLNLNLFFEELSERKFDIGKRLYSCPFLSHQELLYRHIRHVVKVGKIVKVVFRRVFIQIKGDVNGLVLKYICTYIFILIFILFFMLQLWHHLQCREISVLYIFWEQRERECRAHRVHQGHRETLNGLKEKSAQVLWFQPFTRQIGLKEQNRLNRCFQEKYRQAAVMLMLDQTLLQVNFDLTLTVVCFLILVCYIANEAIMYCTIKLLSKFCLMFIRAKRASEIFACTIYFPLLSDSSVARFLEGFWSGLRRSFREECLNIIEIHTWISFSDLKSLWRVIDMAYLSLYVYEL